MLARVADALYWTGRYLERAENVTRLLQVASEVSVELEGLDEQLAQLEWDTLASAVSSPTPAGLDFSPQSGFALPYVRWLLFDDENPMSVSCSIERARENARSVREAITREVFSNLNECHRALTAAGKRRLRDPVAAHAMVEATHRDILTTLGSIEHTLSRDEGWTFMKLGEAMERTSRTLLLLAAKLPALFDAADAELPLFYARWRALLRSLSSLENFRSSRGAGLDPTEVVRFLLFEPVAPRSVRCGVGRILRYLQQLPRANGRPGEAQRILGRLEAELAYDDARILEKDVTAFCVETADHLNRAHEHIAREYFPA